MKSRFKAKNFLRNYIFLIALFNHVANIKASSESTFEFKENLDDRFDTEVGESNENLNYTTASIEHEEEHLKHEKNNRVGGNFDVVFSDDGHSLTSSNSSAANDKSFDQVLHSSNDDDRFKIYSLPAKIILSTLASTASLITICGNFLVMISFFLDRQIRNPTNYFILSLSVSDFVIGLISIPFLTFYLMIGEWPFGEIICNIWLATDYTVCLTSIYTVLFITIDRFCSVKMPAKYRKWRSPKKIIIMVMLTWVIPIVLFFPSIFGWNLSRNSKFDPKNCDVAWSSNKAFSFGLVFAYFWTTLIAIIVLYIFIYQVARNLERKSREKQRKITSLVGCSASNTGALVGALALPPTLNLSKFNAAKDNKKELEEEGEDDFNTDSQSKLSKNSSKNTTKNNNSSSNNKLDQSANDGNSSSQYNLNTTAQATNETNQQIGPSNSLNKTPIQITETKTNELETKKTPKLNPNLSNNINTAYLNTTYLNSTGDASSKASSEYRMMNNNKSNKSSIKDDDFSSSYDSHSDYENTVVREKKLALIANKPIKKPSAKSKLSLFVDYKNLKTSSENANTAINNTNNMPLNDINSTANQKILKPRPETLAVMSYDMFAEKCASSSNKQQSSNNPTANKSPTKQTKSINKDDTDDSIKTNEIIQETKVENIPSLQQEPQIDQDKLTLVKQNDMNDNNNIEVINNGDNNNTSNKISNENKSNSTKSKIPFIDDEFDELSYVLHRRQFGDKENKIPIKEETILIKSTLKSSFFQKLSTPIRNLSRRSSQKSQSDLPVGTTLQPSKFEILTKSDKPDLKEKSNEDEKANLLKENNQESTKETTKKIENVNSKELADKVFNPLTVNNVNQLNNEEEIKKSRQANATLNITNSNLNTNALKTSPIRSISKEDNQKNNNRTPLKSTLSTNTSNSKTKQRKVKHENRARKALRTITFILAAFIFCFAPWHVVSVYNTFCTTCFESPLYHHFFYSCYFLCYMNSPINPFMYALANQQFKKTFIRILKGDWRRL